MSNQTVLPPRRRGVKQGIRGACSAPAERQANAVAWPKFATVMRPPNLDPRLRGERTRWGALFPLFNGRINIEEASKYVENLKIRRSRE